MCALVTGVQTCALPICSAVFGGWVRQSPGGSTELRQPKLRSGLFNHQALLYARSLHRELGPYALAPGLTTADHLCLSPHLLASRIPTPALTEPVAIIEFGRRYRSEGRRVGKECASKCRS